MGKTRESPIEQLLRGGCFEPASSRLTEYSIFRAPVLFCDNWKCWEPLPDPHEDKHLFRLINLGPEAFRGRHLPLKAMELKATEELLAIKAKKRPVLAIRFEERKACPEYKSHHGTKPVCIAIPVYSIENYDGSLKSGVTDDFVRKLQYFMYEKFIFLPRIAPLDLAGMLRLDRLCTIAVDLLEPTGWKASSELSPIIRAQLAAYVNGGIYNPSDERVLEIVRLIQSEFPSAES